MNARLLGSLVVASLLASACSAPRPRASPTATAASGFEAAIAQIKESNPGSPALLNAQLAYADYLLSAAPGSCSGRIVLAQEQLGSIDASPNTRALYPKGWASAADLEYRLHVARAACDAKTDSNGNSKADSRDDLLAAIAAARHAVTLYRNDYDYRSMVVLQFDVAVALHQLGESGPAVMALEDALDMDHEYGLRDDAQQNYALLLTWRGEPAGAAQVAALMRDFPHREVTLKFDWHAGDSRVSLENHRVCVQDGGTVHSLAAAAFERSITANHGGGWSVSYTSRLTAYEPGVWPSEKGPHVPALAFAAATIPAVAIDVSNTGQLLSLKDSKSLSDRLVIKANKLIKAGEPSGRLARAEFSDAVDAAARDLSPGILEAQTTQNYQLETAMWIGAKLQQGVWYQMSGSLALPGLPYYFVQHRIQFAFTRWVPCTAAETAPRCVEIVLHATPDANSLKDVIGDISGDYENPHGVDYDAATEARIVVDPTTLLSYAHEERVFWYGTIGKGKGESVLIAEDLRSTTSYLGH